MLDTAFFILSITGLGLYLWQYSSGRRFSLYRNPPDYSPLPPLSILKPIDSINETTRQCVETWMCQDYSNKTEILLGIDPANSDAIDDIARLISDQSNANIRVVLCPRSTVGNPKVDKLICLAKEARFEQLVLSDADVTIPPKFLQEMLSEYSLNKPDLTCCFYRLCGGTDFPQKLECATNNIDFWSRVAQAQSLGPIDFALGATMTLTQTALQEIGGFESVANHIADDYQLGHRLHAIGRSVTIAPTPVTCVHSATTTREIVHRQIRWARTMRVCKPAPYFLSILSNATLWPLCYWLLDPLDIAHGALLFGALVIRIFLARKLAQHFSKSNNTGGIEWLTPILDIAQLLVWLCAFSGNHVVWGAHRYRLDSEGLMHSPRE